MSSPHSLSRTPALARELRALRHALRLLAWTHGLATLVAVLGAWLGWTLLADWGLRAPDWVRWAHVVVLFALAGFLAWRGLWRPLRAQPAERELALLLERAHGGRDELLVTAVELQRDAAHEGPLAERILQRADADAAQLSYRRALDARAVLARCALALVVAGAWLALALGEPALVARFGERLLGADAAWPKRTRLEVELACAEPGARIERETGSARPNEPTPDATPEATLVRALVPKGARVDVSARVVGRDPGSVALVTTDGARRALARSGPGLYRASLSGLRAPVEGWIEGGDDLDRVPLVRIDVQEPPDVASIALVIDAPAYTREPPRLEASGSARVPAGARVRVHVRGIGADLHGALKVEGSDDEHVLQPLAYPSELAAPTGATALTELGCEFELTRTLRYRVALVDARGLANPAPGLNVLEVEPDRPPRIEWLSPQAGELAIAPGGALRVRALASDDWFVQALAYEFRHRAAAGDAAASRPTPATVALVLQAAPTGAATTSAAARAGAPNAALESGAPHPLDDGAAPRWPRAWATTLLEWTAFGALQPGERHELVLHASDGREPLAQDARSTPLRLTVLSTQDVLRGVQDDLARPRTHAEALLRRVIERGARFDELIAGMAEGGALEPADAQTAGALLASLRRSRTDANGLFRELAELAERVIYARVDDASAALLPRLDALQVAAAQSEPAAAGPSASAWRTLCDERRAQGSGEGGAAAPLVDLVGLALDVDALELARAEQALRDALPSTAPATLLEALQTAAQADARARAALEQLLDRISEWDNYQAVLGLTRDILERQRALRERTRTEATRR